MYDKTADDVAAYLKVTPELVTSWARNGYPTKRAGEVVKIRLEGAVQVGTKLWRFNLKAVVNFIENAGCEEWVSRNVFIPQKMEKRKLPKIGLTSSTSIKKDFTAQLKERVLEQKLRQRRSAHA